MSGSHFVVDKYFTTSVLSELAVLPIMLCWAATRKQVYEFL